MSTTLHPLPKRPPATPPAGTYVAAYPDRVEVRAGDETGPLLARARRDPDTLVWSVTIRTDHPHAESGRVWQELFVVPTLRAVWAIVLDPELVPILK